MRIAIVPFALTAIVLAGCGGDPNQTREVALLRANLEKVQGEVAELSDRVVKAERKSALLEERMAGLSLSMPVGAGAAGTVTAADASGDEGEAAGPSISPGDAAAVASFLETDEGRKKVTAIVESERKKREEEQRKARSDEMRTRVRELINGDLGTELGLTADQKATVERVVVDSIDKSMVLMDQMRDGGGSMDTVREEFTRIRTAAEDDLRAALSVEQFDKLQAERGRLMGFGGGPGGNFGGRTPGGRAGGAGGGR
jgi:hypothetical protein